MSFAHAPARIASLQPSITVTLAAMGALDRLVACTKYCADVVPAVRRPGMRILSDSWSAQTEEIVACAPDLVAASVPYRLESLAQMLKAGITVLAFAPRGLEDIYRDTQLLAGVVHLPEAGAAVIDGMQTEIANTQARASAAPHRPRVYCEEWGKPLIRSQQWVAELVRAAGGEFVGAPGAQTTAEEVGGEDPDIVIAAWCGAGDRVPLEKLVAQRQWNGLRAARDRRIFCINDEFLNTPAVTLLCGLRALASALHPELFGANAPGLRRIYSETEG